MSYLAGQVEAVVLVPGFGAIVRGWALHSLSQIGAVALEVEGGARFPILAEPVLAHERPDLRAQLKLAVDIYRLPGFAALITAPEAARSTPVALWLDYGDGKPIRLPIEERIFTKVGVSASPQTLLDTLPRLTLSQHWQALRESVVKEVARIGGEVNAVALGKSPCALFLTAPDGPSDQFLMLDCLWAADLGGCGLVVFCRPESYGADFARRLNALSVKKNSPLSIALINAPGQGILTLPSIARAIGCEGFSYLGPELFAEPEALTFLAGVAASPGGGLVAYPVLDQAVGRREHSLAAVSGPCAAIRELISRTSLRLAFAPYPLSKSDADFVSEPVFRRLSTPTPTAGDLLFEMGAGGIEGGS